MITKENVRTKFVNWAYYKKKNLILMSPVKGPLEIKTKEGVYALPSDWLGYIALDSYGYPYPIEIEEQHRIYNFIDWEE